MSETIIIEANREISYKDELKSFKSTNVNQNFPDFPNNKWRTQIQTGIPLTVGDQISVEATMIQQKGSPEETIEFSGVNNIKNPYGFVDNKAQLEFQFYITNRQQFNCPLPLLNMKIKDSVALSQTDDYGLPDLSSYDNFKAAYPYRGCEGMYNDSGTYKEVDGGGVFSIPPQPLDDSSSLRMYLMNSDATFLGFQNITKDIADGQIPQFTTQTVELIVPEGFNTPENVAQRITEQFHARVSSGNIEINGWIDSFTDPAVFSVSSSGQIQTRSVPVITDNTYKTVRTCTGDLLYGRNEGRWATIFPGEIREKPGGGNYNEGDLYTETQGQEFFYKNILCAEPDRWLSSMYWMSIRKGNFASGNFPGIETAGTYSGDQNIVNGVGQFGTLPCLLDILNKDQNTNINITYPK